MFKTIFFFYTFLVLGLSRFDFSRHEAPDFLPPSVRDTIIKIEKDPAAGFNFPYYLRIPKGLNQEEIQFLLVETNNSGANDTFQHHVSETYLETTRRSLGGALCTRLKVPLLMPIFPRPAKQWQIYTHAFDRDAALIKVGDMKRLDLQLIAMTKHAKMVLLNFGVKTKDRILMNGFSASGTFCNRFTMIHPEMVAAVACGGINAIPILCVDHLGKTELKYPLGTADFKMLFDSAVNIELYKKVPQYIYMGENDTNDAVLFDDAYSKSERKIVFTLLGQKMIPDRFKKCESIYTENQLNSTFKTYPGIGHETESRVLKDVLEFFERTINEK